MEPVMMIHGGTDDVPDDVIPFKVTGVKKAARAGYEVLQNGGTPLDAVEAAIKVMDDDEHFNTGRGSVLNIEGDVEMDAGIMRGEDLSTGGVTIVREIEHPISLAKAVMEKTPHVLLAGVGANMFADSIGVPKFPNDQLVTPFSLAELEAFKTQKITFGGRAGTAAADGGAGGVGGQDCECSIDVSKCSCRKCDTVGAVALDKQGRMAAGTSTGGLCGKMVGRSSDSSKAGSGFYVDDRIGGISVTGHGESIVKMCLSHSVVLQMENGLSPQDAAQKVIDMIFDRLGKEVGGVVLSKTGDIGVYNTSPIMPYAFIKSNTLYFGSKSCERCQEIDFSKK